MGFSRQEYWCGVPLPSPRKPIRTEENGEERGGEGKEKKNTFFPSKKFKTQCSSLFSRITTHFSNV